MATIVKQWNELPGRAGESLFVCYSWPGLLLALTPPNSVGEPTRGLAFFRQWDSANLAQEIPICSCSPPEIQPDPCKIAAGWRVVCRKREGVVCVCGWVRVCVCFNGKNEMASNGICVFWMELAGFPSAVNSNRAVSWWINKELEEHSYWASCLILPSSLGGDGQSASQGVFQTSLVFPWKSHKN